MRSTKSMLKSSTSEYGLLQACCGLVFGGGAVAGLLPSMAMAGFVVLTTSSAYLVMSSTAAMRSESSSVANSFSTSGALGNQAIP